VKITDLQKNEWIRLLRRGRACFKIGPFTVRLRSTLPQIANGLYQLYSEFELVDPRNQFIDYDICVDAPNLLRRWFRPQVLFSLDGHSPFKPLPQSQALAVFEWGLNWCIASSAHRFLIIHSAVLEKGGRALILPAPPESGKSTLCAGLALSGWRLLSDEMALIDLKTGCLVPIPRPVSLKNESISVIQKFSPEVVFGPLCQGTHKGAVIHMKSSSESISAMGQHVKPAIVLYPRYMQDAETNLLSLTKAKSAIELAENAFNFNVLGSAGFDALTNLMECCDSYRLCYSSLEDVIPKISELIDGSHSTE